MDTGAEVLRWYPTPGRVPGVGTTFEHALVAVADLWPEAFFLDLEPGRSEKNRGEDHLLAQREQQRAEEEGEEHGLAGARRARLDVQRRKRQRDRRPEGGIASAFALRHAVQQPDAQKAASERKEPRRDDAVAQQPHERADQGQMEGAVLPGLQIPAPEMRVLRPPFGKLDPDRRVAVMLVAEKDRRGARRKRDAEGGEQRPLQEFR